MNYYKILNIDPTDNKMIIRRAYVQATKEHHPDHGGDPDHFQKIQHAYLHLIKAKAVDDYIETSVYLPLVDLLYGCTAAVELNNTDSNTVMFRVPPNTYPGTKLEFKDKLTKKKFRVTVYDKCSQEYTRLEYSIVIRRIINIDEAVAGTELHIDNYDGITHTVKIPPNTTADKLIFHIKSAGFFNKNSMARGDLTVIVEITKDR